MDEFILAIVVGVRFARKQGVLSKSFMRKRFCFFCLRRWVVFLPFRWHPRYGVCRSSVAPVRGGTYFSLPPQRKVGKRKRLTPPALVFA
jgi:hypothetical protein